MRLNLCNQCREITQRIPVNLDLIGTAKFHDLQLDGHREAETLRMLQPGDEIYHYFDNESLVDIIAGERVVKSRALAACEACIQKSVKTEYPHYGDGAYATTNAYFIAEKSGNPPTIVRAHGMYQWEKLLFRAVIRIKKPSKFKKFIRTGGVIRSIPDSTIPLNRGDLVGHLIEDGEVVRFEKWNGNEWEIYGGWF